MSMDTKQYPFLHVFRPNVLRLSPYSSARDEFSGVAEVFLDANENPFPHPQAHNRYPDPHHKALRARLSELKGIPAAQIFVGHGSDEAIDLLMRATCIPGQDKVITTSPSYGMYAVSAAIHDVELVDIPLQPSDFQPDADAILAAASQAKLLLLCSPNNPTANLVAPGILRRLLDGFPGLVVVDEAYIDFAKAGSATELLPEYPNLVVLQTLSKAWGQASLRVGMAFAHPAVVHYLNNIKPPYNVSGPTQALALEALADLQTHKAQVELIIRERDALMQALRSMPGTRHVFPSDANFILVQFAYAAQLFRHLQSQGIIVRDRRKQVTDALRITVGTPAENARLLQSIHQFYTPST